MSKPGRDERSESGMDDGPGNHHAWIVRMHTGGGDVVPDGIQRELLLLGWSDAAGLIECDDYWAFRGIVHEVYYREDGSYRRSGRTARQLWNFIHEMEIGDLVIVPHGPSFYVAEITGSAYRNSDGEATDTAHRRPVRWLNSAEPIPRAHARSALRSRMKSYMTVTSASDLAAEITDALGTADQAETPTLAASLRAALVRTTKEQLASGYMDERRFEELVRDLIRALGAVDPRIVGRRKDIGADIEAEFSVGHLANIPVRIQVKYWQDIASSHPVDQLLQAMADVELGIVVTTAGFTPDTRAYAAKRGDETGKQLVLVDGDELCELIVDHGLDVLLAGRDA